MDTVPDFEIWDADNSGGGYTQLCYLKPIMLRRSTGAERELLECEVVFASDAATPPSASQRAVNLRAHEWRSLPIGGGCSLRLGDRVTFRCNTGSGAELFFLGDLTNAVAGFDGTESLKLIFTGVKSRMDDRSISGRVVRAASGDDTLLSGLPCVFNPGGERNRRLTTTTHHPFEPGCTDGYPCFDVESRTSGRWSISQMIAFIFHAFVTDPDITKPSAPELDAAGLDIEIDDVNIEGMTPTAAIDSILARIGRRWALVPEESIIGSNDYSCRLETFEWGSGDAKQLKLAPPGSSFDKSTTDLAAGSFNFDAGSIVNEVIALGGAVEIEALFSTDDDDVANGAVRLYRCWDKNCEGQADTPTAPTKPKDAYFIPYIKGHKDNTKWDDLTYPTRDVGRRFAVNEAAVYQDSGAQNSPPYPAPATAGDLAGLLGAENFVVRPRRFLAARIAKKNSLDDQSEDLDVETWGPSNDAWTKYPGQVRFLPDELGILVTTRDISRNSANADPTMYHNPRNDHPILVIDPNNGDTNVADIRFRAAIAMDVKPRAAFGMRLDDTSPVCPLPRRVSRTITPAGGYRLRLVHHSASGERYPSTVAVLTGGDALGQTSTWDFSGVDLTAAGNTAEIENGSGSYGRLTAKLEYSGGVYTVEVCKGDGGATVAQGSRNTPNGAVTLSSVGGSGLSGSVRIEYQQDVTDIALLLYGVEQDNLAELEQYARAKRNALEAMAVSACPVVPWITSACGLGDTVTHISGRGLSLQANVTDTAEDKRYPQIAGIVWNLDEEQSTRLILDDTRQEQ